MEHAVAFGSKHAIVHHHIMYMLENCMSRTEKQRFNCLYTIPAIIDYLEEHVY